MKARRLLLALGLALTGLLLAAPVAMAADGEGTYGKTTDLVVTIFAFGVMIFFTLFVIGMSLIQGRLESRKERVREEIERLREP
jgi:tellurite resistance protein TehA-like permease